ncbi:MAG: hypothetical protein K2Q22_12295, partial [Cytophagales bacterium]|nr:hypothetical protein [Cytophagales bacterium]
MTSPSSLSISVLQNSNLYTATTSGGTPSLSYAWSNGISGPSAVLSTTGIYQITATDSKGCKAYNQVVIEPQACVGTINLQLTNPSCFNGSNGIISALVTNSGVRYYWTGPGITTPGVATVSQLKKGFYQVSITSTTLACAFLAGADLGQPDVLTATHKLVGVNGVNILVNGGTPNYQVKWRQDNRIADSRTDLTSGTAYTVDITDAQNCTIPYSFTYLSCASVPITGLVGVNQKVATVSVTGGVPSYVYTWPNGSTNTGNSFTFVNNGNYSVQVSDSRNCSSTFPFSITNGGVAPTYSTTGICNQIDVVYITPSTLSINCNCPGACTVVGTASNGNTLTNTYPTPCNDSTFVVKVAGGGYVNVTVKGRGNCGQKSSSTL